MPITKTNNELRFNSGNNFQVKLGAGSWETLGKILSGKLAPAEGESNVVFADGEEFSGPGSRSCKFSVVLAQVSADIIKRIFQLRGQLIKMYYYNGQDIDGTHEEFFVPELKIKSAFDLEMKGQNHQVITIEGSVAPQPGVAECVPDTDLPPDAYASGTTAVNSANPYFVVMDTPAV